MICDRCHQPILPSEAYEEIPIISPSGPGTTVNLHKWLCRQPPTQTAPAGDHRRVGR